MAIQFVAKNLTWKPGVSKKLNLPNVLVSVTYDDTILLKIPPAKRSEFDQALAKLYETKQKDTFTMAGAKMRTAISTADAAIEKGGDEAAPANVSKVQKELAEVCRDFERILPTTCSWCVTQVYKTTMNAPLLGKVDTKAEAKPEGKVVAGEGTGGAAPEIDIAELAPKVLEGFVYPSQDEAEGVIADSKAAASVLDKAMKDANALSKAMREQAKKPVPATATLIKTTSTTLQKSLEQIEKLAVNSQMKLRQVKTQLTGVEQQTKDWKNANVTNSVRASTGAVQEVGELVATAPQLKPFADHLGKPFDGKTVPDFGKLLTLLNRLRDPKPSQQLNDHLDKLVDAIAQATKA